ncbi:lytic polysaccharide monooxygenase [Actinoplanes aureus]|uniref:Lytic polysaccharide monooxygenase n=1 Tax=Actinoplanes aureus TaxID=2792083 RepID=A0A931C735_9ACTN|nr:lytic polysaccharide monooxygenase [Actinoplanes aureus]MBG0562191.1 lytic polysaccharide monooxygenase [Actinoplanes aureus]
MLVRRLAIAGLLAAATVPALPSPALAHGAPMTPISRNAACAGNGTERGAAACEAALKATNNFLGAYDNIRLAGVNGDDKSRVPDGKLCSAGIDAYRGLDLARDDFPATEVRSGQRLAVSYRGTIPHQGSFRVYLTRPGYSPEKKLSWDDLGSEPLADIKDPPLTDGAYRMRVKLPERTGRHILYVVWETSSTPDTYYSCSDLVFPAAVKKTAAPTKTPGKTAPSSPAPTTAAPAEAEPEPSTADAVLTSAQEPDGDGMVTFGHWLVMGALATAALVAAGAGVSRLRRRKTR